MPSIRSDDVAEGAGLGAVAEDRERLAASAWQIKCGHDAAVARPHALAVGVEDPDDARVHAVGAVVGHRHGLGEALGLVVDAAGADRVDVAPVGLGLRVDERVAVDLGGGREEEARLLRHGQARARCACRASRPSASGSGARGSRSGGRRGEVEHGVERPVDEDVLRRRCAARSGSAFSSERWARLCGLPVRRLSIATTSWPSASRRSQRWLPRNPAPPVTRTRMLIRAPLPRRSSRSRRLSAGS